MQSNRVSFQFASSEMRSRPDTIRAWAKQSDNLLLKSLACEVLEIAGGKK